VKKTDRSGRRLFYRAPRSITSSDGNQALDLGSDECDTLLPIAEGLETFSRRSQHCQAAEDPS
jgi:hypothetical protein